MFFARLLAKNISALKWCVCVGEHFMCDCLHNMVLVIYLIFQEQHMFCSELPMFISISKLILVCVFVCLLYSYSLLFMNSSECCMCTNIFNKGNKRKCNQSKMQNKYNNKKLIDKYQFIIIILS